MRAKLREVAEASRFDPIKAIHDALGGMVDKFEALRACVLCATYIGPDRSAGGILYSDKKLLEERFQGKLFLVLKCGPLAFKDTGLVQFGGVEAKPGDWVIADPSAGFELFAGSSDGGTCCRIYEDVQIKAKVTDPSVIY